VFQHQVKVADTYLLVLIGEKLAAIQRSNLRRAEQFRNVVEAGVRAGMRAGVDSALAHAEYSKAQLLLQESDRNARARQYQLMALLAQPELDSLPIDSMVFYTSLPVKPDTLSVQLEKSPLLRSYRARVEATRWRSKAIGRSFLPSVSLVAAGWARGSGVSNTDDSFHTDFQSGTKYQVYNYLFGVAARWTLSDYASIRQRHKSEEQRVVRDNELYAEQHLQQQRQWREGEMQYETARAQARTAPVQLAAAQQAYNQAGARYRSGLTDLPTLLQSMVTLNRAEADVAIAYSNVWRSLLMMAAVQGDLSLFLNAIK
jgi:outer membrane protein TolC